MYIVIQSLTRPQSSSRRGQPTNWEREGGWDPLSSPLPCCTCYEDDWGQVRFGATIEYRATEAHLARGWGGGGGTPYNGLYWEAPPERGTFFRLQVYKSSVVAKKLGCRLKIKFRRLKEGLKCPLYFTDASPSKNPAGNCCFFSR